MAKNEQRRRLLADAGLAVLAREGSRGLTHRAIDEQAAVPAGTASNYFRSRDALIAGLVDRIGERLAPDPEVLERLAAEPSGSGYFADYLRDIVRRLTAEREVTLALYELRLESTRRPSVAAVLGEWQRTAFEADIAFSTAAGLPGGRRQVALFHYAVDGLLFDRLTNPLDPGTSNDDVIDALVAGLLGNDGSR
ncbi:TetR/AcrR family transcriptional regulator [Arthrobacter sulfonylureivorans]|uniref:TetR/AcrR family transcriptional regulator n=1 Tax=Arthrobacter sulfonylureivorans TaxID=2486855 RepID=UPI0039E2E326